MTRILLVATAAVALFGCDPGALLGPDAAQGIDGTVLRGPTCPVPTEGEDCVAPHQASIEVLDAGGKRLVRIRSDDEGRFRLGLRPGRYTLVPESGDPFPTASPEDVEVRDGVYAAVTIFFDTGIRE